MTDAMRETFGDILPASERARRLVGKTLDGYVLEEITKGGEGGFGVVYKASHPVIGKVAVKVLGIDVEADEKAYQRFKREVKLLCDMGDAKNVVDIRHAGIVDGMPWFAMDYVDGESLHQWLGHKKIDKDDLITILSEMLEGLHQVQVECRKKRPDTRKSKTGGAASKLKNDGPPTSIVHRDIKPGNVMIVEHESGEIGAMLIDFGIAGLFRERMEDVSIPNTSIPSMGTEFHRAYTPEYISPELCLSPESVTVQSDLFQVGLIAFEVMTGKRYWDVRTDAEKELRKAIGWPSWLKKVIAKSLHWDRTKRYFSPLEFKRALNHPKREGMKSFVTKPKRLAASIAAIGIVVLVSLLTIKTVYLREANLKLAGFNDIVENNQMLKKENEILRRNKIAPEQEAIRKQIYDWHRECMNDYSSMPERFKRLKDACESYLQSDPNEGTAFARDVKKLSDWLDDARKGKVEIVPKRFEKSPPIKNTDKNKDSVYMKYRFSQGDKECESITISVNDQQNLWGDSKSYPSLDVPWVPGVGKLVIEVVQMEDKKEKKKWEETWSMTGNIIHRSEDELSDWWPFEPKDFGYKFSYTVRRIDFGPIPKLPDK